MTGKRFLIVVIITFLTVVAWAIFDILHSRAQVEIPAETKQLLEPVNPNFDTDLINQLQ